MYRFKKVLALLLSVAAAFTLAVPAFAAVEDTGFSDVAADAWYAEAVTYVRDNGLMSGTSATTFSPNRTMTRAMLATVLYRAAGSPAVTGTDDFTDTAEDGYYADAVVWASENGVVSGYGNGLFGTNDPVSREQIATILWRYDGSKEAAASPDFSDTATIAEYAVPAVAWAAENGIVAGNSDGTFAPKGNATRAQVAVMLHRYLTQDTAEAPETPTDTDSTNAAIPAFDLTASSGETAAFNMETGTVLLNSGYEMPIAGIGTYTLSDSECENSVYYTLLYGGRLIDTARIYGNEAAVGRAIQRAINEGICTREEIFVTTKMWTADYSNGDAAIDASLDRLGLDYIDLMILHHSQPSNDVDAYQAMERAVEAGKLHSIGLSNYYEPEDFDRLVNATTIVPALLQNETHPYHQSTEMKEHLEQYGTVMESWYPLGGRGQTQVLFNDETIASIAAAHGKSSAQVILRWHLQAGNIAIPGSSNPDHILEDLSLFDFELTADEMTRINALDRNERFSNY